MALQEIFVMKMRAVVIFLAQVTQVNEVYNID
jgi:hypothetical protein